MIIQRGQAATAILFAKELLYLLAYLSFLALAPSCSSTPFSGFNSGVEKNSLPFMGKERIRQVHSIAVAPFYNDKQNWGSAAYRTLSSAARIKAIPSEKIEAVMKQKKKDLPAIEPENRIENLAELGRVLRADAVLNGIILRHENRNELILQLISSPDSRVLWWQAVDFSSKGNSPRVSDQQVLLKKMLGPLMLHLGQNERIPGSPSHRITPDTEEQSGVEQQPSNIPETAPKSGSKTRPDKKQKSAEISPM